jgi:cytochrome c-type biogenesis protein CcmE
MVKDFSVATDDQIEAVLNNRYVPKEVKEAAQKEKDARLKEKAQRQQWGTW